MNTATQFKQKGQEEDAKISAAMLDILKKLKYKYFHGEEITIQDWDEVSSILAKAETK